MGRFTDWWSSWRAKRKDNYRMKVNLRKRKEAEESIQPLVWNSKVWITYCGLPIIEADELKTDLIESIETAQRNLAVFLMSEEE